MLAPETKAVMKDVFPPFYKYGEKLAEEGLAAVGDFPAMKPIKLFVCADMKTQWSLAGSGGPLKVATFGCMHCECHKDDDLFARKYGTSVCDTFCKPNGQTECRHRRINTETEVENKTAFLFRAMIEDIGRRNGQEYDWKLELPDMLVDV